MVVVGKSLSLRVWWSPPARIASNVTLGVAFAWLTDDALNQRSDHG
jgi:hypothetical protein